MEGDIRILLVDDVTLIRKGFRVILRNLFKNLFEEVNPFIREANSAEEALLIMTRNDFDLIISDVSMPGMSGFDFLNQIKKEHGKSFWNKRSFIVVSSCDSSENFERAQKLGARFVPKDEEELFKDEVGKAIKKILA